MDLRTKTYDLSEKHFILIILKILCSMQKIQFMPLKIGVKISQIIKYTTKV